MYSGTASREVSSELGTSERRNGCASQGVAFLTLKFLAVFCWSCLSHSPSLALILPWRVVGGGPRMPSTRSTMRGRRLVSDTVPDARWARNRCCASEGSGGGCRRCSREAARFIRDDKTFILSHKQGCCWGGQGALQGARCKRKGEQRPGVPGNPRITLLRHSVN